MSWKSGKDRGNIVIIKNVLTNLEDLFKVLRKNSENPKYSGLRSFHVFLSVLVFVYTQGRLKSGTAAETTKVSNKRF